MSETIYIACYIIGAIFTLYVLRRDCIEDYRREVDKATKKGESNPNRVVISGTGSVYSEQQYFDAYIPIVGFASITWPVWSPFLLFYLFVKGVFKHADKLLDARAAREKAAEQKQENK